MQELKDEKLKNKLNLIYKNILQLKRLNVGNYYCANLLDWFNEVVLKNIVIYKSKQSEDLQDQEVYKKPRQHVYWIDFGRNIGSEFNDYHFAIVVYEAKRTALVVPLTSKKEHHPTWIEENKNGIVELNGIDGMPDDNKECIACVFMMRSVSKKRLSRYGDKERGYFDLKISDEQMKQICDKIIDITAGHIDK